MTTITAPAVNAQCTPAERVTRSLLGYGIIAGPMYVLISLGQAVTRDGFDLVRHEWSLLANGSFGWIQSANLVLSGAMIIAAAVGLAAIAAAPVPARAVGSPAHRWLRGEPDRRRSCSALIRRSAFRSVHQKSPARSAGTGSLTSAAAAVGFACLGAACFVLARRFAVENRRRWAVASRLVGVVFLTGFAAVASSGGSVAANLAFTAAVIMVCGWLSAVSIDRYGR